MFTAVVSKVIRVPPVIYCQIQLTGREGNKF